MTFRNRLSCRDPFCTANDGQPYDSTREIHESKARSDLEKCQTRCYGECNLGSDFSCYQNYTLPDVSELVTKKTSILLRPKNILDSTPISSAHLEARDDNGNPLEHEPVSIGDGEYELVVPGHFTGLIYGTKDGYAPANIIFGRPLLGRELWDVPLMKEDVVVTLANTVSKDFDFNESGILVVSVFDCTHNFAPQMEVRYTSNEADLSKVAVLTSSGRIFNPEETIITDELGTIFFVNVPPGEGLVSFSRQPDFRALGVRPVVVHKGEITWATLYPTGRLDSTF